MAKESAARKAARSGSSMYYQPPRQQSFTRRSLIAVVLCFLCPPAGILFLWVKGIFLPRGRVVMTVIAAIIMTVIIFRLLPSGTAVQAAPAVSVPKLATAYPVDEELTALSNMDDLLAGVELTKATAVPETTAEPSEEAVPMDIMQLTVYSVRSGAKYYHKAATCDGQVNRRTLTLQEAYNEGLAPCPDCNPMTE